jgi:hypothetical protein
MVKQYDNCVNDELERMWKEAAVSYFNVLSEHLLGGLRKPQELQSR